MGITSLRTVNSVVLEPGYVTGRAYTEARNPTCMCVCVQRWSVTCKMGGISNICFTHGHSPPFIMLPGPAAPLVSSTVTCNANRVYLMPRIYGAAPVPVHILSKGRLVSVGSLIRKQHGQPHLFRNACHIQQPCLPLQSGPLMLWFDRDLCTWRFWWHDAHTQTCSSNGYDVMLRRWPLGLL